MNELPTAERNAKELRLAFDQSFSLPPQPLRAFEDLLLIRVAGEPYAVSLLEISGLVAVDKIVHVPSVARALLGLVGIRGEVVPVFGLASLLGYEQAPGALRWMILCGAEEPVALAFSDFEGHLRLLSSSLYADEKLRATRHYVNQVASTAAGVRSVISISLIVAAIWKQSGAHRPTKEQ